MTNEAPQAGKVNWNALSPAASECLGEVALRLTAGWTLDEVAEHFDRERPSFRHMTLPTGPVTKSWVSTRMRELRTEIRASVDPD